MRRSLRSVAGRRSSRLMLRRLMGVVAISVLLVETLGPLTPVVYAVDPFTPEVKVDTDHAYPNGQVIETTPAPISIPASGGETTTDSTIGGEPLFLPYTPPADTTELISKRSEQSRTLASPDGSFSTEISEGPINYLDESGAWQPIDLSLIETSDRSGFKVASHGADITIGAREGLLGSISAGGHTVTLSAPPLRRWC